MPLKDCSGMQGAKRRAVFLERTATRRHSKRAGGVQEKTFHAGLGRFCLSAAQQCPEQRKDCISAADQQTLAARDFTGDTHAALPAPMDMNACEDGALGETARCANPPFSQAAWIKRADTSPPTMAGSSTHTC